MKSITFVAEDAKVANDELHKWLNTRQVPTLVPRLVEYVIPRFLSTPITKIMAVYEDGLNPTPDNPDVIGEPLVDWSDHIKQVPRSVSLN